MKIPIAYIGKIQKKDIEKSSGTVLYNTKSRICTVIKSGKTFDDRGDKSPIRMAELFGGDWRNYNEHYIIQVAGCPLDCWYCYVDNLHSNIKLSAKDIIADFCNLVKQTKNRNLEINVLHLMGGIPAKYPGFWGELRERMDKSGFEDKILFSDVIFVENYFYQVKPWEHIGLDNFLLAGCLKGTNKENFLKNTGRDLFDQALKELEEYAKFPNFYLSLINYDEKDLSKIFSIIPREKIDFLRVVNYEVTKSRKQK